MLDKAKVRESFWSRVKHAENGCWIWTCGIHRDGYGKFIIPVAGRRSGVTLPAHRVAYAITKGKIPDGAWVLHTCDNRACVNPDHLYLGDAKQNAKDRTDRKRWWVHVPEATIEEIRQLKQDGWGQTEIARKLDLPVPYVGKVLRGAIRGVAKA